MQHKKQRKHKYAAPVGGLYLLLLLIGVAAVVWVSINLTQKALDNSSEKAKIENIVRPVLMFDPVPFEKPTDIAMPQLLEFSMWANLSSERRASYVYGENGELIIPSSDLDVAATRLFGNEIVLEHQTFGDYERIRYHFDTSTKTYLIPVSSQLFVYSPQVDKIEREGDLYKVTMNYIPPIDAWTADFDGNKGQPAPEKQMYYMMRKVKDGYQIVALRDIQSAAANLLLPSSSTAQPPVVAASGPVESASSSENTSSSTASPSSSENASSSTASPSSSETGSDSESASVDDESSNSSEDGSSSSQSDDESSS